MAKETGAGMSRSTALRLRGLGVRALDVGGVGGTSFAAVEGMRAEAHGEPGSQRLGELLRDWGPTRCRSSAHAPLNSRSSPPAASATAWKPPKPSPSAPPWSASPAPLQAALHGDAAVDAWITQFLLELRTILFLTGSPTPQALQSRPHIIAGPTRAWLDQLAYSVEE